MHGDAGRDRSGVTAARPPQPPAGPPSPASQPSADQPPAGQPPAGQPPAGVGRLAPRPPLARRGRQRASSGVAAARRAARTAARKVSALPSNLPPGVGEQIGQSAKRLTKVRSLKGAKSTLIEEAERLFLATTPLLAAAPLPLTGWRARVAAGGVSGAGAAVEEADELATLVSWGGALPSAPVVAGALFTAWLLHLWIAISARVNQLRAAGRDVDPQLLGRELAGAYLGDPDAAHRDGMAKVVRGVAVRAVEGWLAGLIPGVGIAFDAYTAQRTVARILREPVTAHPPRPY